MKYKLGQKKKNTSQEVQLQQVCLQDNKSFVLGFNLVHYLVTLTVLKESIFVWFLGKKFLCYTGQKLTSFDKVNSYGSLSQNLMLVIKPARKGLALESCIVNSIHHRTQQAWADMKHHVFFSSLIWWEVGCVATVPYTNIKNHTLLM